MKIAAAILLLLGFINQVSAQFMADQAPKLFRIVKHGKVGFINETGKTMIKPVFAAAGEFSENFAPARVHGLYGFIDLKGKYIIQPQFEFAEEFQEGVAIVYQKGKTFCIDRTGRKLFESPFAKTGNFHNGLAWGRTASDKSGLINKQGRLVVDTVFRYVNYLDNGTALVTGLGHKPYPIPHTDPKVYELGLVDTLGNFLIPFGRYSEIAVIENGYFLAQIPVEPASISKNYALINPKGQLVAALKTNSLQYPRNNHDSVVAVLKSKIPGFAGQKKLKSDPNANQKLEQLKARTSFTSFYSVSDNYLIAEDDHYNSALIDKNGKQISTIPFTFNTIDLLHLNPGEPIFIRNEMKWGLMDTTGNLIFKPQFDFVDHHFAFNSGTALNQSPDYFFYTIYQESRRDPLWGIATKSGQILTPPLFQEYDRAGFQNGLLTVAIDNRLAYLNRQGKIVWQENKPKAKTRLNLDYRFFYPFRGDFEVKPASEKPKYSDVNYQHPIPQKNDFTPNALSVKAKPGKSAVFSKRYKGFSFFVGNTTNHDLRIKSQDYRLNLVMQAQDSEGQWHDISNLSPYLYAAGCGNSHAFITLKQGNYWEFTAPVFEGSLKTTMRFSLTYLDPETKAEKIIYSNEFPGKVNPGQLWRGKDVSGLDSLPYLF